MIDRKVKFAEGLSKIYLPYYEKLCLMLPDGWLPYQGYRSFPDQAKLYSIGRDEKGNKNGGEILTNAKPGLSAHNYGMATDWTIFTYDGRPMWPKDNDTVFVVYHYTCDKIGLKAGISLGSVKDSFHNELNIDVSWDDVYTVYEDKGMDAVEEFVSKHIRR